MRVVVVILMLIVCFNYMLKQTFHKWLYIFGVTIVSAIFIGLMWPYAIEQSKTQIADWLANQSLMLDTAILLYIEIALQITYCLLSVYINTTMPINKRILNIYRFLYWIPGILIFPVLFYVLVTVIFSLPGLSFPLIAWGLAFVICVIVLVGTKGIKWLLPEEEIRLELLFMTNVLMAILGIIATVNGRTAVEANINVDMKAFISIMALIVCGSVAGLIIFNIRRHLKTNK